MQSFRYKWVKHLQLFKFFGLNFNSLQKINLKVQKIEKHTDWIPNSNKWGHKAFECQVESASKYFSPNLKQWSTHSQKGCSEFPFRRSDYLNISAVSNSATIWNLFSGQKDCSLWWKDAQEILLCQFQQAEIWCLSCQWKVSGGMWTLLPGRKIQIA